MPTDVYGVTTQYQKEEFFPSAHITLEISSVKTASMVVQNVQWTYGRQIQPIRAIGTSEVYQIAQPGQGQLSFSKLASKDGSISVLLKSLSEKLNNELSIVMQAGPGYGYTYTNLAVASYGVSCNAESRFIQENITLSYTCCEEKVGKAYAGDAATKDIYGVTTTYGAGDTIIRADQLSITSKNSDAQGLLIQNMSLQYGRQIQPLKEIGSPLVYNFALPAQGTLSIDRVVGSIKLTELIDSSLFTNGANNGKQTIIIKASSAFSWTLSGCVIASVGGSSNANNYMVQQNIQIRFTGLL